MVAAGCSRSCRHWSGQCSETVWRLWFRSSSVYGMKRPAERVENRELPDVSLSAGLMIEEKNRCRARSGANIARAKNSEAAIFPVALDSRSHGDGYPLFHGDSIFFWIGPGRG